MSGSLSTESASHDEQFPERTLSSTSNIYICLILFQWGLIFLGAGTLIGLTWSLNFLPAAIFAYFCYKNQDRIDWEFCIRLFGAGYWPGAICVLIAESALAFVFAAMCFSDQIPEWIKKMQDAQAQGKNPLVHVEPTIGYWIFLFLFAFAVAGLCEELLKYYLVDRKVAREQQQSTDIQALLTYSMAGALGFSCMENGLYSLMASFNKDLTSSPVLNLAVISLIRSAFATPFHVLTACLIGIRVIERDIFSAPHAWYDIIAWPVFFHGLFDYLAILLGVLLPDQTGEIIGFSLQLGVALTLVWLTRRWIHALPQPPQRREDNRPLIGSHRSFYSQVPQSYSSAPRDLV